MNLKNDFSGHEKDDVISYVSALANMEGGHLVVGVEDLSPYLMTLSGIPLTEVSPSFDTSITIFIPAFSE